MVKRKKTSWSFLTEHRPLRLGNTGKRAGVEATAKGLLVFGTLLSDECAFAIIPDLQKLVARSSTDKTGVNEPSELDTRDVPRRTVDPFDVPTGLRQKQNMSLRGYVV